MPREWADPKWRALYDFDWQEYDHYVSEDGGKTWTLCKEMSEWVNVERRAGFNNTLGYPECPGTGGFGNGNLLGKMELKDG